MIDRRRRPDNHYEHPMLARIYDVTCGWSVDRDFYLALTNRAQMEILDLGCGTGLLCDAYAARGHRVTGVDPAVSMLDVAIQKPHADRIEWINAFAQDLQSEKRFDLIVMTGHAFQVLLSDEDVVALFRTARRHLKPAGRFVFESRNPVIDWVAEWNGRVLTWPSPYGRFRQSTHVLGTTPETISFEHVYDLAGETLTSASTLRFASTAEIDALLDEAGLTCSALYGDWDGSAFAGETSREMIFTAIART